MTARSRYINTEPSALNLRALWERVHDLDDAREADRTTIAAQAATITDLEARLAQNVKDTQQAQIAAGKATAAATTTNNTGPGGGGGGGGDGSVHPNYLQYVIDAKAELVGLGEDLTGACGAFKITRRVAQLITPSDPTVGLLDKPTGNNCGGYAVDVICFNDGLIYDILYDAGGGVDPPANGEQWNFLGQTDPARYRASF